MKSVVRNNILNNLHSLSHDEKKSKSLRIQAQLQELLKDEDGHWVAFHHLSDEPELNWSEISGRIEWAFPKIENSQLVFHSKVLNFAKSAFGFKEPQDGLSIGLNEIEGFVIPGLAFDKNGYRLGRGKGFYDRSLAHYSGKKIGVCFGLSLCEELPHEAHDIRCTQIVTENEVYEVRKAQGDSQWN